MRILLVEDDLPLQSILAKRLKKEDYAVDVCADGLSALDFAQSVPYDALVLDIMLPKMDGIRVIKTLRAEGNHVATLLLTAKGSVEDRVGGLDAGADDYLAKPFAYEELLARIRSLLRRPPEILSTKLSVADLFMDTVTHTVARGGEPIVLTGKEYALLEYLLHNINRVLTRQQILDHVWNYDYGFESNIVDVYIRYLRNKIDKNTEVKLLHTIRNFGYMLKEGEA